VIVDVSRHSVKNLILDITNHFVAAASAGALVVTLAGTSIVNSEAAATTATFVSTGALVAGIVGAFAADSVGATTILVRPLSEEVTGFAISGWLETGALVTFSLAAAATGGVGVAVVGLSFVEIAVGIVAGAGSTLFIGVAATLGVKIVEPFSLICETNNGAAGLMDLT